MRLVLRNLTKNIEKTPVFNRISYSFESGLIYGLTGAKHSGKTLLFRSIAGEEAFDRGHIRINRDDKDYRIGFGDVGCVFTNSPLPDFLTGEEFVEHFLELHDMPCDKKTIKSYLKIIGIASGWQESVELVSSIIEEAYNVMGTVDVYKYLKEYRRVEA